MSATFRKSRFSVAVITVMAGVLAMGVGLATAAAIKVTLSGDHEIPPVKTSAAGNGMITVGDDKSVSGSVTTSGIAGTAAHIHEAASGKNGPVIVPLTKTSDNVWSVSDGAKFTDAQYKAYQAGDLYVNVHSDAHKDGEIRGQLKP